MQEFDYTSLQLVNAHAERTQARYRQLAEHFQVNEVLPFSPAGEGPHVMLQITKTNTNTDWLAKTLADYAGVNEVDIGFAGLKDRHAVTTQWFTINTEGKADVDWSQFNVDNCQIITETRHNKKLKRGALSGNEFNLIIEPTSGDKQDWEQMLQHVKKHGVPNYFGEQRFGFQLNNLRAVEAWFTHRRKPKSRLTKSLLISSARSWLFNLVLSERIKQNNWNTYLIGDVMQLAGSHSSFKTTSNDDDLIKRLNEFDIDPTGPLWGQGELPSAEQCLSLEENVLDAWPSWKKGLENQRLKQERRALRVRPESFEWQWNNQQLKLSFFLPAGCFATSVLRELAVMDDVSQRNSISTHSS
ncbi:MAG TPA: tRNA pseudouridine(13) synthase TruD [Methylophaga aminisulfidivorans]|uniref:tRNA pseudouridine synthase D n=2 Tax=root TaxID=1 RepID=A0A7C1ZQN1_9GAMM|nr:tRNA pseudouridine(13) synthase TruD [Methylophaga aminisulfidivorans]HEC73305.1 tRNA pseudouridine(13) synthase TruD [Methylophaga aminisulfidivorans]